MKVYFQKQFEKQYYKFSLPIQKQFLERLELFLEDKNNPLLRIHRLKGDKFPYVRMNVTGDVRALFLIDDDEIIFYEFGTHSELYKN